MDHRRILIWAAALALGGAAGATAKAGAITYTGNADADFPKANGNGVYTVPGLQPNQVAQASWITQAGWINGWVIKDMHFDYNKATDTMQVGVQFYSIAGAADGNPAGTPDPRTIAAGGADLPNLGGLKSISVGFAPTSTTDINQPGAPIMVAGVPEDKTKAGTGTDGFTVTSYLPGNGIQNSYGTAVPAVNGGLAFDPSPAHPDFEFSIKNWSMLAPLAGTKGFWISAYAGSPNDVVAGESNIGWVHIPSLAQQTVVPEPATLAGWTLLVGGAAWALRRSRTGSSRAA